MIPPSSLKKAVAKYGSSWEEVTTNIFSENRATKRQAASVRKWIAQQEHGGKSTKAGIQQLKKDVRPGEFEVLFKDDHYVRHPFSYILYLVRHVSGKVDEANLCS